MTATVRPVAGQEELVAALALRHRVFCDEQGVLLADELDGRDQDALHLVAIDGGRVVGACRLLVEGPVARFGRLAVERPSRGRGLGAALLEAAEREARGAGARLIELSAQVDARGLYSARGYRERGEVYLDAGIDHIAMEKALA